MGKIKFELDIYGEKGDLRPKGVHSFTTDLSLEFDQTPVVTISSILIDVAAKITPTSSTSYYHAGFIWQDDNTNS